MSVEAIVAVCVGLTILVTFIAHIGRIGYRLVRTGENVVDKVGKLVTKVDTLVTSTASLTVRVDTLEKILNNGIRSEVTQARRLASDAARAAAVADQTSREGQAQLQRAINALRAEVDIYTNVVIEDRHKIRRSLVEAGLDLRDDEE